MYDNSLSYIHILKISAQILAPHSKKFLKKNEETHSFSFVSNTQSTQRRVATENWARNIAKATGMYVQFVLFLCFM